MAQTAQPKSTNARERLLALAEAAVLQKGFAATSIDELIVGAGITKSGFFYHFKDKSELAKALMQRYIDEHNGVLAGIFKRADELNEDPLHGFLVALKLLAEMMADLPGTHPGCLVSSFVYQDQLLSREVRELTVEGMQGWRRLFRDRLAAIAQRHPPRIAVDLDDLADMANTLVDGGIILSKLMHDKEVLPRQVMLYREFVRAVFLGA
ncbi:MAG TPA: TetR/AcrR family transcriptional regulator [Hyphomicrobiaceae bacterium]|jgi:AcrR family transcriptional regulator|nr:TetR/AcrR family transcriptional regulator [Hyphomicrobiaceae bacterium]